MTGDRGDWFCTVSGRRVFVLDPHPEDIFIDDIATALSHTCRFGGQVSEFYSVAQHSVIVSRHVPHSIALEALLHDAAEAYLGDVIRPLKRALPDYKTIEAIWEPVIRERFGLSDTPEIRAAVKCADIRALLTERRDVAPKAWMDHAWKEDEQGYDPFPERIVPQSSKQARFDFRSLWEVFST